MGHDVSREELIDFFRSKLISWEYEEAKDATPKELFTKFTYPSDYENFIFFQEKVFGDLSGKLEEHVIPMVREGYLDVVADKKLYNQFTLFNPAVIFYYFDKPKLSVLERKSLSDSEKAGLIHKGEDWLEVLYWLRDELKHNDPTRVTFGNFMSNRLERLLALADPSIERSFVHTGVPVSFYDLPEDMEYLKELSLGKELEGLAIMGFKDPQLKGTSLEDYQEPCIILNNTADKSFEQLIGQPVKFHSTKISVQYSEYGRPVFIPTGTLISVVNQAK
jgi:hypothetical protein